MIKRFDKMKVLWICGLPNDVRLNACEKVLSPTPTAAWTWILGHLPPPDGVELHIVCPVGGLYASRVDFEYNGVYWHCFRRHRFELPLLWFRFYLQIKRFVKELNPDVIHGWGGETGCGRVATLLSKRAIVSVQGLLLLYWQLSKVDAREDYKPSIKTKLAWMVEKLTYKKAAKLLVESVASKRGLKEYYGLDGELLCHPLRNEFLLSDLSKRESVAEYPLKLVFVGSLVARKGAIDAVQAFVNAKLPSSSLVMIGDGCDRDKVLNLIKENGIVGQVQMRASLSPAEIVSEFSDAQFFLLPSYGDTGPTALKEALACGLYPICYDNSGPKDLISHYGCGRLVETSDVGGLTFAIKECIDQKVACVNNALKAANKVRNELSRESVWGELTRIYNLQMELTRGATGGYT